MFSLIEKLGRRESNETKNLMKKMRKFSLVLQGSGPVGTRLGWAARLSWKVQKQSGTPF